MGLCLLIEGRSFFQKNTFFLVDQRDVRLGLDKKEYSPDHIWCFLLHFDVRLELTLICDFEPEREECVKGGLDFSLRTLSS